MSPADGVALLQRVQKNGYALLQEVDVKKPRFETWKNTAVEALKRTFGELSDHVWTFQTAGEDSSMQYLGESIDMRREEQKRRGELEEKCDTLIAQIDALELLVLTEQKPVPAAVTQAPAILSKNVFIVHGHDEVSLLLLEKMIRDNFHLTPIVLRDQPNESRVLIDKFTEVAIKCSFAFVLLTPDDTVSGPNESHAQARPNVIFELGWFWGRFEQKNVLVLLKEGVKLHSDLDGLTTIRFRDKVTDKFIEIERELRAAGLIK